MTLFTQPRQTVTGLDGKTYYNRPLSRSERDHLVGRTHYLSHDEDLSVREIQDYWLYNHDLRRSVGTISAYLKQPCVRCSRDQSVAPEHPAGADATTNPTDRPNPDQSVKKETHPSLGGSRVGQ